MEPLVEPNEEVHLDFGGPLSDELIRDAYILVAIDKWSKFLLQKFLRIQQRMLPLSFYKDTILTTGYLED